MRKKTNSVILAVITALSVILPHAPKIIPEGKSLIAASAVAATLSIPSKSAAAIIPVRIVQIAASSLSQNCDAGVMDQLCASVTYFLDQEAAKADADAKACKKNCRWKKSKDDLIDAARKKAKDSCAKGEAPDVNELSKGLDRNTKDKLKDLYNRNSRMFDGTAKLKAVDFNAASSKDAAVTGKTAVLGKGGQVTDLKSAEPTTPRLNSASEFSLSGTKLSEDTSNPAATKQSPILLAAAASAKTLADTAPASSAKSPAAATASAAENQSPAKSQLASSDDGNYNTACLQALKLKCGCSWEGVCSGEALTCFEKEKETCRIGGGCSPGQVQIVGDGCGCQPGTGQILIAGKCACREGSGQVIDPTTGKCGCPVDTGQVLNPEGKCVCAPDYIFTIAKKCEPKDSDNGRHLTIDEILDAQKIFGNKIPDGTYNKIVLVTTGEGESSHLSTFGFTIYIPGYLTDQGFDRAKLIHELAHVYQRQTWWKYWPTKIGNLFQEIGMSTEKKYSFGTLTGKESFGDYRLEQQAAIIQAYYFGTRMYDHQQPLTDNEKTIIEKMLCGQGLLSKGVCDAAAQKKI